MTDEVYPVPREWARRRSGQRRSLRRDVPRSVEDPDSFWRREAQRIDWIRPFTRVRETSFHEADFGIKWFADGTLNLSANCLDRHLAERGDVTAIIWEPDDPSAQGRVISYRELHQMVCRFANALKAQGVARGDRVTIYLPMVPEAAVAMLASPGSARSTRSCSAVSRPRRSKGGSDCDSRIVVTADEGLPGRKTIPLRHVDAALVDARGRRVIVMKHTGSGVPMQEGRDIWWAEAIADVSDDCRRRRWAPRTLVHPPPQGSTASGRAPYYRQLCRAGVDDPQYLRLPARADLLVFRRRRLGHQAQLYRLRSAGQRRDRSDVRGSAQLAGRSRIWQIVDKHQVEIITAFSRLRALEREGDEWCKNIT
jgi:acetyl-CoA synthetase